MRIGDRYKYVERGVHVDTWEIVEIYSNYDLPRMICVEVFCGDWSVDDEREWNVAGTQEWIYLGNFAKSTNFNTLYDKLSA